MTLRAVGIFSPGDMGHSVGEVLRAGGARVVAALADRSERTRALAAKAGIEDVGTLDALVREADAILSILVPAQAEPAARQVAAAIRDSGATPLYVDCNAIAPSTARVIAGIVEAAGGRCADAGIVGPPPRPNSQARTRFLASGAHAEQFAKLAEFGLDVTVLGPEMGAASGFKMCYAALTKGLQALGTELLTAATALGFAEELRAEFRDSMPAVYGYLERSTPSMPPKAHRWIGEMEEIAKTFGEVGLTPLMFQGAADLFRFVATTPIGHETPENRDPNRGLDGVVTALARELPSSSIPAGRAYPKFLTSP